MLQGPCHIDVKRLIVQSRKIPNAAMIERSRPCQLHDFVPTERDLSSTIVNLGYTPKRRYSSIKLLEVNPEYLFSTTETRRVSIEV